MQLRVPFDREKFDFLAKLFAGKATMEQNEQN